MSKVAKQRTKQELLEYYRWKLVGAVAEMGVIMALIEETVAEIAAEASHGALPVPEDAHQEEAPRC